MATTPPTTTTTTTTETPPAPVIENEIPAYRAISKLAVGSLLLGLLSLLCFADMTFLAAAVLAIIAGVYAERRIRRMPDVLTGRGLAQAGIVLGLACGLGSVTISAVSTFLVRREAEAFGKQVAEVLESREMARAIHIKIPYEHRKDMTPREAEERMIKSSPDKGMIMSENAAIVDIHNHLKAKGSHVDFVGVEAVDFDRLTPVAGIVLRVHGADAEGKPLTDEFAGVEIRADPDARGAQRWHVGQVAYPYKRGTFTMVHEKSGGDDGHGH